MEKDHELLGLAAKAAGIAYDKEKSIPHAVSGAWWGLWLTYDRERTEFDRCYFNPLTNDGDALRLMAKLNINVSYRENQNGAFVVAEYASIMFVAESLDGPHEYDATRRAITRAAAEMQLNKENGK